MPNIHPYLTPIKLTLDAILLDPNNPRFSELDPEFYQVPESRFADPKVQRDAFEKMKDTRFDVIELRDTIKAIGFLQMDRVVVRKWSNEANLSKYVVVEGNRRVTALKWLIEMGDTGKETFTDQQKNNFLNLEVLLLDTEKAPTYTTHILPGLRHVSGIKEWGAYQKAKAVFELREKGIPAQEVAQSLGLSVREANKLWRAYLALKGMAENEEYGEGVDAKMYSYFEEVFKKPSVKVWLGWDDTEKKFTNEKNINEFYTWILGEEDTDSENITKKLPEAKSIRELGTIINDEMAMAIFRAKDGSLIKALAKYDVDHPEDLVPNISRTEALLSNLSPDRLRNLAETEIHILNRLNSRIKQVLEDKEKLTK